jgi:hypothetical protein
MSIYQRLMTQWPSSDPDFHMKSRDFITMLSSNLSDYGDSPVGKLVNTRGWWVNQQIVIGYSWDIHETKNDQKLDDS